MALLSDEEVGLGSQPKLLSDEDVGLGSPKHAGALSNAPDDDYLSAGAKSVGTAAVKGISNSVGTVGNLGNFADYLLARGHSAVTGRPVEDVLAQYAAQRKAQAEGSSLGRVREAIDPSKVMPSGEDISAPILKRTGEYEPTSEPGKMAQAGLETAFGMLGPGGGAAAEINGLRGAITAAGRMAPGAFAAGAAGQGVTDATGDPLLGMMAGAAVPAVGGAVASKVGRVVGDNVGNAVRPFAEDLPIVGKRYAGTRDQMTGERLLREASNPEALDRALFPGPMRPGDDLATSIIPGSKPTLGQYTGDMGMLQAERQARTADNTAFNVRDADQNAARVSALRDAAPVADTMRPSEYFQQQLDHIDRGTNEALERIQTGAQHLASSLGPGENPEASGAALRTAMETAKAEAKKARTKLYDAVDPDGSMSLVATPVRERAQELAKGIDAYDTPMSPAEARIFGQIGSLPDVAPFKSLVALDKNIYAAMSAERRASGETPTWGRLSQLKKSVLGAINDAVDNQADYEQAAVSAGKMRPEDTIWGRLEGVHGEFGGALGVAPRNAGAADLDYAGAASSGISGVRGSEGQGARGSGNAARAERVPAEVTSAFVNPQAVNAPSLLQFIASRGGLGPDAELNAIGAHSHTVSVDGAGRRKLVRQGGWPLDYAREAAEEAGYLRGSHKGTSTVNDLLDAIDAEMRGQKRYPEGLEGSIGKREAVANLERERHEYDAFMRGMEDDLSAAGYSELGPDVKRRATRLMADENMPPDTAVEHALHQLEQEDHAVRPASSFPGDRPATKEASPPLEPNFDRAAADRLRAAKEGHIDFARTYRNPAIKRALGTQGGSDNYTTLNSALPSKAVLRGPQGYQTAKAFLKAAKNDPNAVSAMLDQAASPLRSSLKPDGTINTAKFQAWKKDYAGALRALDEVQPGFSRSFDNAARASDVLVEAGAVAKRQLDTFQKSEAAKLLKLTNPTEVENHVGAVLSARSNGPTRMRELVNQAGKDPAALDGLRKAGIDWMARKFATTAEAATSGEKVLSGAVFQKFVRDNAATLSRLYPEAQVGMFRAIADDLARSNRSVTATAIKGSPGTAKDVLPFMRRSMEEAKKHASILSAAMTGSLIGFESGAGLKGAVIGAGTGAAAFLLGSLRAAGIRTAEDMFRDALLNPDRARYYISKVPAAKDTHTGPSFALGRSIRRELMLAPVVTDKDNLERAAEHRKRAA